MQSVAPFECRLMKAGLVGSQAVYPRASNVERIPPDGNEDASGSPTMRFLPEKSMIGSPSFSSRKESCFSAVEPVIGRNQWV